MTGNVALEDLERLLSMANSERPLVALPARRQIVDWAKSRENFDSDEAFERATLLASSFCRTMRAEPAGPDIAGIVRHTPPRTAGAASLR